MSNLHWNTRKGHASHSRQSHAASKSNRASLALCLAAAAITVGAAALRVQKDRAAVPAEPIESSVSSYQPEETAAVDSSDTAAASVSSDSRPSQEVSQPTSPAQKETVAKPDEYEEFEDSEQTLAIQVLGKNLTYVRPVGGAVTKDYSMDGLVYSKTMGDWRVHTGVDLAADKGEVVKAAAEGKVAGISNDPLYGTTVVVNQNDGMMVYYRGLTKDPAVREGENISAGAAIGTVGEIPCESADGFHLHLEVMSEGSYLNPCEVLGIR